MYFIQSKFTFQGYFLIKMHGRKFLHDSSNFLNYSYLIPITVCTYIFILMCIQAPGYIEQKNNWQNFAGTPLDYLKNMGVFIYGYSCITSYSGAVTNLTRISKKRLDKVTNRTFGFLWLLYLPIGIIAYMCFGDKLKQMAVFPNRKPLNGSSDIAMKLGKGMLIVTSW